MITEAQTLSIHIKTKQKKINKMQARLFIPKIAAVEKWRDKSIATTLADQWPATVSGETFLKAARLDVVGEGV